MTVISASTQNSKRFLELNRVLVRRKWIAIAFLVPQLLFCNSFLPIRAQSSSPGNPPPHSSLPDARLSRRNSRETHHYLLLLAVSPEWMQHGHVRSSVVVKRLLCSSLSWRLGKGKNCARTRPFRSQKRTAQTTRKTTQGRIIHPSTASCG